MLSKRTAPVPRHRTRSILYIILILWSMGVPSHAQNIRCITLDGRMAEGNLVWMDYTAITIEGDLWGVNTPDTSGTFSFTPVELYSAHYWKDNSGYFFTSAGITLGISFGFIELLLATRNSNTTYSNENWLKIHPLMFLACVPFSLLIGTIVRVSHPNIDIDCIINGDPKLYQQCFGDIFMEYGLKSP